MTDPAGRNAPCPCGSGRRYKNCCYAADRRKAALTPFTRRDREAALRHLMRYGLSADFEEDHAIATLLFWGTDDKRVIEAALQQASEQIEIMYNSWFVFDLNIDEEKTPLDLFLSERGRGLTAGERAYLERMRGTHLRPYEVLEVEPDRGLKLRDLWSGEVRQVRERAATHSLAPWDVLAARLLEVEPGLHVLEGGVYPFPVETKAAILEELRRWHKKHVEGSPHAGDDTFFKRMGFLFHHLWLEHVLERPRPEIRTPEGDLLEIVRVSFAVEDGAALRDALERLPDLETDGQEGEWVWTEAAGGGTRLLGSLSLSGDRLDLETMSRARAERSRKLLEKAAGPAIRHRATVVQDPEQALRERPAGGTAPRGRSIGRSAHRGRGIPPEEEELILKEFYDRHYREWLDEPIPALGGRTPREAASLKKERRKVAELLKMIENRQAHAARRGEPTYDIGWVWEELGMKRQ